MLGENLKKLRTEKGMSQEYMAQQLNVVRQTVSKWEKGLSEPDAGTLMKIAELLGVSVSVLLGEEVEEKKSSDEESEKKTCVNSCIKKKFVICTSIAVICLAGLFGITALKDSQEPADIPEIKPSEQEISLKGNHFIRTYNIENIEESNDEAYIYVTLRQYQREEIHTVKIERRLCPEMKTGKDYEFEFVVQDEAMTEFNPSIETIFRTCKVVEIIRTDKTGTDQIQEPITKSQ